MIVICELSLKVDFRRQRDTLERHANSNKLEELGGPITMLCAVCTKHPGSFNTPSQAFHPLHSQELLLPLKSTLSC